MVVARRRRTRGVLLLGCVGLALLWATRLRAFVPLPSAAVRKDGPREFLQGVLSASAALSLALGALAPPLPAVAYDLPPLGYAYDALEPVIDKETMMIHHDKHHATYVAGINTALEGQEQPPLLDLVKNAIKSGKRPHRNAGGGVWNHNFFWLEMAPKGTGGAPSAGLQSAINEAFGSTEGLQEKFAAGAAPAALFGSGWAWVVVKDGKLEFTTTVNQDNPLMEGVQAVEGIPILGLDVWEHAYYLKYQNRRPEYISNWWELVNWNQVNDWYEGALQGKAPAVDVPPVSAAAALVAERVPATPERPLESDVLAVREKAKEQAEEASRREGPSWAIKFNVETNLHL